MRHSELRVSYNKVILSPPLISSDDAYRYFMGVWDKGTLELQERIYIACLNRDSEVIGHNCVGIGTDDSCLCDLSFIMAIAVVCRAKKLIIAHNHPSGKTEPSDLDMVFTEKISVVSTLLAIEFVDHIILSKLGYYSFKGHNLVV